MPCPVNHGELYDTLCLVVRRLNRKGWHSGSCNIHPKYESHTGYGHGLCDPQDPPHVLPGGACDCGADELAKKVNSLMELLEPGKQLELLPLTTGTKTL